MSLGHRFPLRARIARQPPKAPMASETAQVRTLHRSRLDRLLSGAGGARVTRLLAFLQTMTLADGAALIAHVKVEGWPDADRETQLDALSIINARIAHLRERAGLAPIDDPLPGERDNVFLTIRKLLGGA